MGKLKAAKSLISLSWNLIINQDNLNNDFENNYNVCKKASEKATKIEPAFQYVEKEKPKWGADIFGGAV